MPVKKEEAAWVDGKMMGKGWKRMEKDGKERLLKNDWNWT
jgi:hypothetical protein